MSAHSMLRQWGQSHVQQGLGRFLKPSTKGALPSLAGIEDVFVQGCAGAGWCSWSLLQGSSLPARTWLLAVTKIY